MGVAEHLVGRAAELGSFDLCLDELDRGAAVALQLVGEPGIGKTRLLAELAELADARRHLVLEGSASELERDLPFWVFVDALDEYVQGLDPERLAALDEEDRAELAQVLPAARRDGTRRRPTQSHERYRAHRAIRSLLERLAVARPVVLVLDDLHWADAASLELVAALLHRRPAAPVLLATATRPHQLPHRIASSFERAHRSGTLTRLRVGSLTFDEARELLRSDGTEASELYEESGGNPFYLEELARAARADVGAPVPTLVLDGAGVPGSVVAALAEELALLSPEGRLLLQGAAVAGDPFEPELAAAGAATTEDSALGALDELSAHGLVRPTEVPRRFRFRHPLVRRAVYESAPAAWRLGAHQRCADLLSDRGAAVTARAHHIERSAGAGDRCAIATLREAGDEAAESAPDSAAHWYGAALRLLPDQAPVQARLELLDARAAALAAAGRLPESRDVLVESLRIAPGEARARQLALIVRCARVEHLLGLHLEARARLERALAEVFQPESHAGATLMLALAVDRLYAFEMQKAREWSSRVLQTAAALEDPGITAEALAIRALASAMAGLAVEAPREIDEAAVLIDALSDEQLGDNLDASAYLASAEWQWGRVDAAVRHAERTLEIARATHQSDLFPDLLPVLGAALSVAGRLTEARDVLEGAVDGARLGGNPQALAWAMNALSDVFFGLGEVEAALELAHEAAETGAGVEGTPLIASSAAIAFARAFYELGEPERAAEALLKAGGGEELPVIPTGSRSRGLLVLTRCLLASGHRELAERSAAAAEACAKATGRAAPAAMAELTAAELTLDAGDALGAGTQALQVAARFDEIGRSFDATTTRLFAGRALARAGRRDEAVTALECAAGEFDSYGSERYRNQAEHELRKLGRKLHRRSTAGTGDDGLAALTGRERQLAQLVVDRKTNSQIAAELFLSQKTVESHLRNIFRKLGVANRVELARAVEAEAAASGEGV